MTPKYATKSTRWKRKWQGKGRVLIRPSGTEALVRVMLEGEDQEKLSRLAEGLANVIETRLG